MKVYVFEQKKIQEGQLIMVSFNILPFRVYTFIAYLLHFIIIGDRTRKVGLPTRPFAIDLKAERLSTRLKTSETHTILISKY